jgi:hypothetical protein
MSTIESSNHVWRFFRAGGTDQVLLETAADFLNLGILDQKLWVALCCPTKDLECDTKTLELIDTDKDGRIRVPEILAAIRWLGANLKDLTTLKNGSGTLPLNMINEATEEGAQLLASARQILIHLGKPEAPAISVADTMDPTRIFTQTQFNGDGIVPPHSAEDPATQAVINDIIDCCGGEMDRSGKMGINQAKVELFFSELKAFSDWNQKVENQSEMLVLGQSTHEALTALKAVRAKVNDYFARCRLAAFDPRSTTALNRSEADYAALSAKELSFNAVEMAHFPLAHIEPNRALPLSEGLNPAWAEAMHTFRSQVVKPLLGEKTLLAEEEWKGFCGKFNAYESWLASKGGGLVEKLGLKRVRTLLAGDVQAALAKLIAKDKALEPQANSIGDPAK